MRVTSKMMLGNYLNNINNNLSTLTKLQTQQATGKRINKVSDDPTGFISSMKVRVKLYKTEQYERNVGNALSWLDQTESSFMELNEVIKSAYDTAVNQSTGTMSPEDKRAAAELIGQLRDHVIDIGNTKSGDKYIFGGYNVSNAPFKADGAGGIMYNGLDLTDATNAALLAENDAKIEYAVGFNITMDISTTGTELFGMGDDNIYSILDGFYNALMSDAPSDELGSYITKLQDAQDRVLSLGAEIGGKTNRLELIQNRFEEDVLTYTERKSNIENVDQAEAIMNYKMAEAIYIASLQIGASIIQPSLLDFLK